MIAGPLVGIVVFMVWVYPVAVLVLFGAEVMVLVEHSWEVSQDDG